MKIGYGYCRQHTDDDEKFSINVDEEAIKVLMKHYEGVIKELVGNGNLNETYEQFKYWKRLNDLLEDAKGEKENE